MQIPLLLAANPKQSASTGPNVRIRKGSWRLCVEHLKDSILDLQCVTPRTAPQNDESMTVENIQDGLDFNFEHPTNLRIYWRIRGSEESINVFMRYEN